MNEFYKYHPAVNFLYFTAVIAFSMIFMHPICLIISLSAGFSYAVMLGGKGALRFSLLYLVPLMIMAAIINPAFNHEGLTILTYLPSGNPLTLESIVYGIAASAMLAGVICHFSCLNRIMTSDKIMYLFGKIIPSLSLLLSMVLRFVPKFRKQLGEVSAAQKGIGRDVSDGNILKRAKNGMRILSVMITKSLEDSIDTADSMKARGYGLPKRSAFSNFKFTRRDAAALVCMAGLIVYIIAGAALKKLYFRYFPSMRGSVVSMYGISVFTAYFLLFTSPIIIEIREAWRWKRLKSKI